MLLRESDGEEMRLVAEYDTAAHNFAWAVREVSRYRDDRSSAHFRDLQQIAGAAHAECLRTKKAFEEYLRRPTVPPPSADPLSTRFA
jgi:hypothetical protein